MADRELAFEVKAKTGDFDKKMKATRQQVRDSARTIDRQKNSFQKLGDEMDRISKLQARDLLTQRQANAARRQARLQAVSPALQAAGLGVLAGGTAGVALAGLTAAVQSLTAVMRKDIDALEMSRRTGIDRSMIERTDRFFTQEMRSGPATGRALLNEARQRSLAQDITLQEALRQIRDQVLVPGDQRMSVLRGERIVPGAGADVVPALRRLDELLSTPTGAVVPDEQIERMQDVESFLGNRARDFFRLLVNPANPFNPENYDPNTLPIYRWMFGSEETLGQVESLP